MSSRKSNFFRKASKPLVKKARQYVTGKSARRALAITAKSLLRQSGKNALKSSIKGGKVFGKTLLTTGNVRAAGAAGLEAGSDDFRKREGQTLNFKNLRRTHRQSMAEVSRREAARQQNRR